MPNQVAIVHGWSDSSKSFVALSNFLAANGRNVQQIWLGDYISMDDDVRVEDAGKRMHQVIGDLISRGELDAPFDLIVHSTGGLLAREWISANYPDGKDCPVKRLVMLAPANFGSRLASLGKSMIGRVSKGWNNWFQTGAEMLKSLELGSSYQWELAHRDLLSRSSDATGPYGTGKVWPFVIIGSKGYPGGMRQIINEDGSDGTVRVAAANLNAIGLTIDFSGDSAIPEVRPWHRRAGDVEFPFAVLPDRDHGTIVHPEEASGSPAEFSEVLGTLILSALNCKTDDEYRGIAEAWKPITEATAELSSADIDELERLFPKEKNPPSRDSFHQFFHVITAVRDDHHQPVRDYFLEFYSPDTSGSNDIVYFQREVVEHVHVNGQDASMRCLHIDREDLLHGYYPLIKKPESRRLAASISAASIGRNVRYFDAAKDGAKGHLVIHAENEQDRAALNSARLRRNTTHLIEIIIHRRPLDRVFSLSKLPNK